MLPKTNPQQCTVLASFPGPCCFQECGGPGIFSHVPDVKGRKNLIECGHAAAQNSKKS